ncbi:hypothetical protein QGN23_04445 [Chryseobacterium gotjawalense]|uniref:Uncharacterized protein n=1 Tax=Chryseobacterium gotjawalense TaxID=3042315 RepID=A0ABY8RH41_9FLAO|nr:hypothetical protein [Chryseobacterium sp. wdc7]WHF52533.1 hypothetical protein QGN23_04445 [Chryseobacterium sp. wdc7]
MKTVKLLLAAFLLLQTINLSGQKYMVDIPVSQQDPRVHVTLMYQEKNSAFGVMTQDYRILVKNNTADKLKVYIEYGAQLVCGSEKTHQLGPLGDGITIEPSQTVGKPYATDGIGSAVRLTESSCPKDTWRSMGKDASGSLLYSMISSVSYRIVNIENISEKDRAAAVSKRQKQEDELKRKKQDDELKQKKASEEKAKQEADKNSRFSQSANDKRQNSPAATGSPSAKSSSHELSEKVKVNGEYVQVFRQNGIPYIKRPDGSIHQTTETAYTQISHSARNNAAPSDQQENRQAAAEQLKRKETENVLAKLERERMQQEATNKQVEAAVSGVTDLFTQAIMQDAQEKERRYEREQLRRQQNDSEAYKIVNQYEKRAERGDEQAIEQMIKAQYLMSSGNPVEYMKSKRQTFGSQTATDGLINHYQRIITATDNERSGNFLSSVLYLAGGAGAYFLLNSLSADEKESEGTEIGMKEVYQAGAYGFGGTLGLVGVVSLVRGLSARGPSYRAAVKELNSIRNNTDVAFDFTPTMFKHDNRNTFGLALKLKF